MLLIQEAGAAMGLNGQQLGDRALKVENAKSARETTPQGAANPYTAMQLQQMQQLQMQQMASSSLAAQVCRQHIVHLGLKLHAWQLAACLLSLAVATVMETGKLMQALLAYLLRNTRS